MNVPKLRFKEFTDEWLETTINNIATINPKNSALPDKFIYIDLESVENGILRKENLISKEEAPSRAQRQVKQNDILFQTVRPYQQNNLFVNKINDIPYIASTGYALLRTNENPYFLFALLHQKSFLDNVLNMCTGTSFPAISSSDLGTIFIRLPKIEEQKKIAILISLLDKKIELQSKKIEVLKLYKKGLSNKIFNKKNMINWNKKNISELGTLITAKSKINTIEETGIYNIVDMGTVNSDGRLLKHKKTNCNFDLLKFGDLIIPKDDIGGGLIIGKCAYIDEENKYILSDHLYMLRCENENTLFISYQINSTYINQQLKKKVTGSAQLGINAKNINEQSLFFPDRILQRKISNSLFSIDKKIDKEITEKELLNQLKKGLMQNMFV